MGLTADYAAYATQLEKELDRARAENAQLRLALGKVAAWEVPCSVGDDAARIQWHFMRLAATALASGKEA